MPLMKYFKPLVEKCPPLADFYRFRRDSRQVSRDVEFRNALGFRFNGHKDMEAGTFEPDETRIIEKLVPLADIFVNIGANTGYYVCRALQKGVPVIAFEPDQLNVKMLLRNVQANNFSASFQLFPVALSDKPGILPLYGASTGASLIAGWAGQGNSTLVPVSVFDQTAAPLVAGKTCFVLIDVEGAELGCLKGAEALLKSSDDNVFLIEISVAEHQPTGTAINKNLFETFELMKRHGYSAYAANDTLREITLAEVSAVASTHQNTLGTHNFLFVKDFNRVSGIQKD